MPADYDSIRAGNITRYGTDTAVLDLLGQLYSDRTHFIFELIQNAEDAGATRLSFELSGDRLVARHDGRPFTEADVRGICGVATSTKSGDLTAIGTFGIGFKAVYACTQTPSVHSGDEHFRIENYVRPAGIGTAENAPDVAGPGETLFVFPFDRADVPPATAVAEISAALAGLDPATLLFLRHIERVTVPGGGTPAVLERQVSDTVAAVAGTGVPARRQVRVRRSSDGATQDWLVWHRDLTGPRPDASPSPDASPGEPGLAGQRVEIAIRVQPGIDGPELTACTPSPLVVFFPTQKETFLGFWVQGPYRTTPARDNVPEHDPANQALARETAALLTGVLADLRDEGWLTAALLEAMPLDAARFGPGSLLRPLYDAVTVALANRDLIPAAGGGYRSASELTLAQDAGLRELLSASQLSSLPGMAGPRQFASGAITADGTPALWRHLRAGTGIAQISAESFAGSLSGDWLAAQPDDWIRRLYAWLYLHLPLWSAPGDAGGQPGVVRSRPIIRLENGSQVLPFDAAGRPAVYLPSPAAPASPASPADPAGPVDHTQPADPPALNPAAPGPAQAVLPTVRLAIARFPDARRFLEALQLGEPDLVAEVLESVLPRYAALAAEAAEGAKAATAVAGLDAAQHQSDLERVAVALGTATPAERDQLTTQLRETPFLVGENAATGEQALTPPDRLYLRTPDLESYFSGNPACWFARDTYGPWYPQLREMGVRDAVAVHAKPPGADGHVSIAVDFARHERGLHGFDPDAVIDGLQYALSHPSHRRSEFIWNQLLVPHRSLLTGTVERSVRLGFADASREEIRSAIGAAATAAAWLPGPDGTFCLPADLELDDLPPVFQRDDALALALGMVQPVVAQAARQLGLAPSVLRGLAAHPDLVALVERELKARAGGTGTAAPQAGPGADPTDSFLAGWLRDD